MRFVALFTLLALVASTVDARYQHHHKKHAPVSHKHAHSHRYVHTPAGRMLKECVHTVPSGSRLYKMESGETMVHHEDMMYHKTLPKCDTDKLGLPMFEEALFDPPFPADYDGWLAYTAWNFNQTYGLDSFLGDFSVPAAPAVAPDILYIFTGLQNIDWIPKRDPNSNGFDIIQPVLQYPGDFGNYWSVKSWYVTIDAGAINSDELQVKTGDYIFGNMTRIDNTTWYVGSTVGSTGQTVSIQPQAPRLATQPWAYNTLECYGCIDCTTYPSNSPSKFTKLSLTAQGKAVTPTWILNPKPNPDLKCHETIIIHDPTSQDIVFN